MLRKAYNWVISWSDTPYGVWALFILAFVESSCFPIPPDVLLIALCVGLPKAAFQFATICTVGSVLGGIAGYAIGVFAFDTIGQWLLNLYDPHQEVFNQVKTLYDTWGFWGVLVAAITPIPYKVFTIASGVFKFDFFQFVLASILGRSFRFFLVAGLIYWKGATIKVWIDKYFDWLAWGFLAVLILGFALLKFF
ncbi:cytochrome B [Aphanothece hegewaldii CCALA 016]|uniref:Cytochrome B n=1 Tax=Aphanothece hegewaldii CCALA 016 TaxID=2107694 RepID=A0A2T1LXU3_9CHRO|nr:YqaA family protein [Aphanothece hegewaldii]PSF37203.1 cytochrome B [Aphanothece hegewaldii CCALA 016]